MKRKTIAAVLVSASVLLSTGVLHAKSPAADGRLMVAQGMMGRGMMGGGGMMGPGMMGNIVRHRYVRANGLPPAYRNARNPLPPTAANIGAGAKLYATNCASCHGPEGYGDGPAGAQLNPPPANLTQSVRTPIATDPFLYWTIEEGGQPVGSAMPPFKDILKPEQVWQIILFVRQL
jgi:mono/diheme cytochrome c family protein